MTVTHLSQSVQMYFFLPSVLHLGLDELVSMEPTDVKGVLYFRQRKLQEQSEMTTQLDSRTELMVGGKPSCQLTCLPFPFCRNTRCQGTLVYSSAQTSGDSLNSFIQQ